MGFYQDGFRAAMGAAALLVRVNALRLGDGSGIMLAVADVLSGRFNDPPPEPSPWRPISEAPKDGTVVDLWCNGRRHVNYEWHNGDWINDEIEAEAEDWSTALLNPTHFMLPPPGPEGE